MAEIDGGGLSFKSVMDNSQLNAAIEETMRRIQGYSDAVVGTGDAMDDTTKEIIECIQIQKNVIDSLENSIADLESKMQSIEPGDAQDILKQQAAAAKKELEKERQGMVSLIGELNNLQAVNANSVASFDKIRITLGQVGAACEVHENELQILEARYEQLTKKISEAFFAGRDNEYRALKEQQTAIGGEISMRRTLLRELREQSDELEREAGKLEETARAAEDAANKHVSMRTRIRELKEEMMSLVADGIDENSEAYKALVDELGRLQDIQGDVAAQGNVLANDEAKYQGIITGLNGVVGGFTAAQGAVAMFAGENENLQKIMLKVQSLMSITIGLQQVAQALNKDSAFQLVTLNGLRQWWNKLLAIGHGKQIAATTATAANTAATAANTAATAANATAATAGTAANIGLAGAFRMVGAAIKSIPVFGWIVAAIGAIIAVVSKFSSKAREAKKAVEEFTNAMVDNCYKPIGTIELLSQKWSELGDNMQAKEQFIKDNAKSFEELGVSVKGVTDAENILIANKDKFVEAQIAKAKAMIYAEQSNNKLKELIKAESEYNSMPDTKSQFVQTSSFGTGYYVDAKNTAKEEKAKEIQALRDEIRNGYKSAMDEELVAAGLLKNAGIEAVGSIKDGTIAALENALSEKNKKLKDLSIGSDDFKQTQKEIEKLQKEIDAAMGRKIGGTSGNKDNKDEFKERLDAIKIEYQRFMKWVNSGDSILVKSAYQEFDGILKQGATYIDYLKAQRQQIIDIDATSRTDEQNKQLQQLNDAISEETKKTVLESFNAELNAQLDNAKSIVDMLNIIEQRRKELKNDGTELDNEKGNALNNAEKEVQEKQEQEMKMLLDDYASFEDKKTKIAEEYAKKRKLAQLSGNQSLVEQLNKAEQRDLLNLNFEQLKGSPEYISAFEDLDFASTETLQNLITRFEEVKNAVGANLNPEDVQQYISTIREMVEELNSRDPFGTLKRGYQELKIAENELKAAEAELQAIRDKGGKGTEAEVKAIAKVNKAKDAFNKKNGEVRKSEKEVEQQVKKLCNALSDVGAAIGGQAGQIISLIGDVGSFVITTIDSVKAVAAKGAEAISTVEKASVILGVVSAAYQVASKIVNMFTGDDGTAAYEAAKKVYESYIDTLHDVIDAELELLDTMTGKDAQSKFDYAISLINKEANAARELGKQYLNAGASKGFIGIGSSASHGVSQRKNITQQAWNEAKAVADAYNIDWAKLSDGRMTGLFDLTTEQLAALRRDAPLFFAQLHEDTRKYINDIIATGEAYDNAVEKYNESLTGITFDSMKSDFLSALQDMELDAKNISNNIQDYMRKALIANMFKKQYQDELKKYYDAFANSMKEDSEGGALITENEKNALDAMRNAIVNGATHATEEINKQFKDLFEKNEEEKELQGVTSGVTEETASKVEGQMNAIRINQLESAAILRNQLVQLSQIAQNTSYNRHLSKIDRIISLLESNDSLRAQGLS